MTFAFKHVKLAYSNLSTKLNKEICKNAGMQSKKINFPECNSIRQQ